MIVNLQPYEMIVGAYIGARRYISKMHLGDNTAFRGEDKRWETDIESALAEAATAKALNRYWDASIDTYKKPDVPPDLQVRWTCQENGSLLVRPKDSDTDRYILVIGEKGRYKIVGWMLGADAKQDKFKRNPGNKGECWFVPQNCLRPIGELE